MPDAEGALASLGVVDEATALLDAEEGRKQARSLSFVRDPSTVCVSRENAHRTYAEDKELQQIGDAVKAHADDICAKKVCTSNIGYSVLAWNPWVPVMGSCSLWAHEASDAVGQPSYFDKRREQRCVMLGVCHFVVVLTNPRTGEEHVIDAWSYAGGWSGGGRQKGSVFSTRKIFNENYPHKWYTDNHARGRCTRDEGNDR